MIRAVIGWMLRRLTSLSHGLGIGFREGFDSGTALDYAYQNTANGRTAFHRFVDRLYLNARAWKLIRERYAMTARYLADALSDVHATPPAGRRVRLLDLGAGHGRLSIAAAADAAETELILQDHRADNFDRALELAEAHGVSPQRIVTLLGDAASTEAYRDLPAPIDVVLVSGLYEWLDDAAVSRSLARLAEAIRPGGRLIYTGHPWHPDARLMAGCLPRHTGGLCQGCQRPTEQLDGLVEASGFGVKRSTRGRGGVFTVTEAVRR